MSLERKASTIFVTMIVIIALVAGGYRTAAIGAAALIGFAFVIWFSLERLIRLVAWKAGNDAIDRIERPCWVLERLPRTETDDVEREAEPLGEPGREFILKFRSDGAEIWIAHFGVLSRVAHEEKRPGAGRAELDTSIDAAKPWHTLQGTVCLLNFNDGEKVELEFHYWSGVEPESEAAALDQIAAAANQLLANGRATVRKDRAWLNEAEE